MKTLILLLIFFLPFTDLLAQPEQEIRKPWESQNLSFTEFVNKAEQLYNLRFFYKEEWMQDLQLQIQKGDYSATELIDNFFKGTSFYYFISASGNVVITRNFAVKMTHRKQEADTNFMPPADIYESDENVFRSGNLVYDIGNPAEKNRTGNVVISGYINDRDTREPVSGVTVYAVKQAVGTMSNAFGFFSITLPRGTHMIQFSFIGMKEKQIHVNLYSSGELNVEMNSTLIPLKETIVSAQKNIMFQRYEVGVEKINIASFKLLPTSMGESDIFKSVLLIPGVQSVGEGSTGFNVRGGSTDQNLILLYGSPIYNASHFFGFFSVVNSDIIKDVTLFKGGIPARYGGRISSVLDISAREGNRKEFTGNAGISPITTHLMIEGPLIKDTLTFMLNGRTTYSNWIFKLIDDPSLKNSRASFNDLNGKLTYDFNRNNKLDLSAYLSNDSFRLNSDSVYSYVNSIVAFRWRHFFSSRFLSSLSVNNSSYRYDISSQSIATEGFILAHNINSTGLKADFNWFEGRNEVNFGVDLMRYSVLPGSYLPSNDSSLVVPDVIQRETALETGVYIEDKYVLNDYLSVNAGLRFSSFFVFGPKSVLLYEPSFSKRLTTVSDTLNFKANDLYRTYAGPEFRLSLNFKLSSISSLKLNYNRTKQYLHLLSNTTSISPYDTWKLSDYYIKPQTGDQYAMGFYILLPKGIETSIDVYYKKIRNMVDYKGGTKLIMNGNVEKDLVSVIGRAYGIELLIKKTEGRVRWSAGYTYARTFLKSVAKFSDEVINAGKWFPANFDKPNDLITTFNYIFSRRLSVSGNYTWSTGRPITYPIATYHIGDVTMVHYSERNKYRIPDYMRLDLSVNMSGNLKSKKLAHQNWTFSIYNVLGRENVYSVYFKNENKVITGYKLSVFGRAIPSLTYSFDF